MQVAITGASGFLGRALAASLEADGHRVLRLVRRPVRNDLERLWDGSHLTPDLIVGSDALVNLSGAGVGDKRWSPAYKELIRSSRIEATNAVAHAVAHAGVPVLLNASAIGFYGDRGDTLLDETSSAGDGFLAEVCQAWEAAVAPAQARARVALLRTGIVLGDGGSLAKQRLLFKVGLGAPLGSGRQWLSWISVADHVAAVRHLLSADVEGPVNLVAPDPLTNRDFTKVLGRVVHRPTLPIGVPRWALHLVLGEFAQEVLGGQRVVPGVLERTRFAFRHPDLPGALEAALA